MTDLVWTPVKIRLGQIKPWSLNPRMSSKAQAQRLIKSERDLGQIQTLAISPMVDGFVDLYDGHQRCSAWLTVKEPSFEVLALQSNRPLTEDERRKVSVTLHTATGSWDWDALSSWSAADLHEWGMDKDLLREWNNETNNLKEMLNAEQAESVDAEPQTDRAAELLERWGVKTGDLWQIGEHRLVCGDCTDEAVVARVMGGEKADMLLNDPPYGMRLDTDYTKIRPTSDKHAEFEAAKGKTNNKNYSPVIGDDTDYDPTSIIKMFPNTKEQFWWGADYYAERLPSKNKGSWLVWDKRQNEGEEYNLDEMFGASFELCWSMAKHKRQIIRVRFASLFGTETQDTKKRLHPTQKAVQVPEWIIKNYSEPNAVIVDCYVGSGTTLVACQNLSRRGRAVEISPAYCAVTLQRMADAFPELEIKRLE